MNRFNLSPGDLITNPFTGQVKEVKWASDDHVQYTNGSCTRGRDFEMFHSDAYIERKAA